MNGKERILAVLEGRRPDRIPTGFWMHFPPDCFFGENAVRAHLDYFDRTKTDLAKVMTEHLYPCDGRIRSAADWRGVPVYDAKAPFIEKQAELIARILCRRPGLAGAATVHGVVASASHTLLGAPKYDTVGRYALLYHLRTQPEAVHQGLQNIARTLCAMVERFVKAGAQGIYYAALGGEADGFTPLEHARYIAPLDRMVLEHAYASGARFVILHICKPKADLTRFIGYPCDVVNWGVRESGVPLQEGSRLFPGKVLLGGFDHSRGPLAEGDRAGIARQVQQLKQELGTARLILGSDCTLPTGLDYGCIAAVAECAGR